MPLPLFSIALAVASTVGGLLSGNKARKASKKANAAVRAINKLKNEQAKRAFLRNFRQAQAAALVQGVASGVGIESSTVQGVLTGQASQSRTAISEFNTLDALGAEQTRQLGKQASANFAASAFGAVSSFASSAGGGDFLDSFGKGKPPTLPGGP